MSATNVYNDTFKIGNTLDFAADIELTGERVITRRYNKSTSGNNICISVGENERVKLYKVLLSPNEDITGEVKLLMGSTEIAGVYHPKAYGEYVLLAVHPDFELGGPGEDVIVNLPESKSITFVITYNLVQA